MSVKAKKLKSGSYRCQVYDYTDLTGKKHYKSFTSKDKKEAEKLANEFIAKKENHYMNPVTVDLASITVKKAIDDYIEIKTHILSPSTICGYIRSKERIEPLFRYSITNLNSIIVQRWIAKLSKNLSPKTIQNTYGLMISALKMYKRDISFDVTFPKKRKSNLYTPNNNDVIKLLEACKGTHMEIAILLSAFGPMRRGEIVALTYGDIEGNVININKAYAQDINNNWILKAPKTYGSYRKIEYPQRVIDKITDIRGKHLDTDEIIPFSANCLTSRFCVLRDNLGLKDIRFHDLRHYSASILHAIGVPDKYIMERGGWSSDYTMKRVYQDTIDEESKRITNKINTYFENL